MSDPVPGPSTPTGAEGPDPDGVASHTEEHALAGNSIAVAGWTLVSRVTGFLRVATVAAVLGPTFFGNTFQAINVLPNLTFEFLTGAVLVSLLVPPLVRCVDRGDRHAVERIAGGFLGVALLGFGLIAVLAVVAGPLLLRVLLLGVADPAVAEQQQRVGMVLVVLFAPQIILYGLAATGAAVMNAHDRFALAAAAPAFESLGVIITLVVYAFAYGTGPGLDAGVAELLLLGLGTTAAVGLHAAAQLWGARRVGVRLVPRAGWRDPEVRQIIRRAVPSLGYGGLNALRTFGVLVVANRVPGGVVAFQLALNFFHLPVAVCARPVAVAVLPALSRLHHDGRMGRFRDELTRAVGLAAFLVVPAAAAYAALAFPLARAAAFGEMATPAGITMIAVSLGALAAGLLGEGAFVVATHASYARHNARTPLRSMALRTLVTLAGIVVAFTLVEGTAVLVVLGLALSAGNLASAWHLGRHLHRTLPPGQERVLPPLLRAGGAAGLMVVPALLVATTLPDVLGGRWQHAVAVLAAAAVGLITYIAVHKALRSPELAALQGGLPSALQRRHDA